MLAKHLTKQLEQEYSVKYLTRKVTRINEYLWALNKNYIDPNALKDVNTIIHLAGSGIADKRWPKKRKHIILSSRVDSAHLILNELKNHY
jgi:NAD dependent epimerase/dehydratase family enzyme